jgi:hypothetical protein
MNWRLIFRLSFFGLAMAFATLSWIPAKIEPAFWLVIFVLCAWLIAKNAPGKFFLHGFLVSIVNSVWITAAHVAFFGTYIVNHPEMKEMSTKMPLSDHPRRMMLLMGPVFGVLFGLILGVFALVASKMVKNRVHT